MKLAGNRLRLGAAALLTTIALGAVVTPGIVSAGTPSVTPSAEHQATGDGGKCYEQVVQYKYERPTLKTDYKYVKETQERTRETKSDPWGPWSAWTVWNGGNTTRWENASFSETGDHDGQNDNNTTFDRDYRYVQTGETRQVPDGNKEETTDWLPGPPQGEGWVQIDQRTVNGQEIPCDNDETKKVTLCHATGSDSNPYEKITVSVSAFLNAGHISHGGDIYEAFSYIKTGQTHSVAANGDTSLLRYEECELPPPPQPADKVEYGQWNDGTWRCGDTTVTQTRTKTVTPYVLQGNTWVPGTPQATTETRTRSLTDAEIQSCKPDHRQPSYTEWVDAEWDCGATTVTQTRTRTDYVWVNTGGSTWVQQSTETTETQTRPLTEGEIASCRPDHRDPSRTEWVGGTWECGDTTVTETRTRTDHTWVNTAGSTWELKSTAITETRTRDLTDGEMVHCNPPSKDPRVERQDVGTPECGATMIEVEVTTTSYSYTYNEQTNSWDEVETVTETTETRDLGEQDQFPCKPSEWTPPTVQPVCGPENDTLVVPENSEVVYYEVTGWVDGVRTITAFWTYDDSELDSWTFTDVNESCREETTTTTTQPPTTTTQPPTTTTQPPTATGPVGLDITAIGPVCQNDAPYIDLTFGNQPQFNGRPATVTFIDLGGDVVKTETSTYQAGQTVRFVYPGAEVDASGNPLDWPGWVFTNGQWVVDPSDAGLRDGLTVSVEVNPTASAMVSYPEATPSCDANPPDPAAPQGQLPLTR